MITVVLICRPVFFRIDWIICLKGSAFDITQNSTLIELNVIWVFLVSNVFLVFIMVWDELLQWYRYLCGGATKVVAFQSTQIRWEGKKYLPRAKKLTFQYGRLG